MQSSIICGVQRAYALATTVDSDRCELVENWRGNFDGIRDINDVDWREFAASIDPSNTIVNPCRRCGQMIKVPIASDVLCGGKPPGSQPPLRKAPQPRPIEHRGVA